MSDSLYIDNDTPDDPAPAKAAGSSKVESPLDRLKEKISAKVTRPEVILEVPDRPGVALKISPNITQKQMKAWRRNAGEDTRNGMDPTKFAAYVVGHTTIGIEMDEEEVFDENGFPLNFASADILASTDCTRPVPDAVMAFFPH